MASELTAIYIASVLSGETNELLQILSKDVTALSPTSADILRDPNMIVIGLSIVSKIVSEFRLVRTYEAGDNWHAAVFDAKIDGEAVQFSDHLHVDENNCIDHIEIFMRPTSVADAFNAKMAAEIQKVMNQNK